MRRRVARTSGTVPPASISIQSIGLFRDRIAFPVIAELRGLPELSPEPAPGPSNIMRQQLYQPHPKSKRESVLASRSETKSKMEILLEKPSMLSEPMSSNLEKHLQVRSCGVCVLMVLVVCSNVAKREPEADSAAAI